MITAITTQDFIILALTPVEKWRAAGRFETGIGTSQILTFAGGAALLVLVCLFVYISYKQFTNKKPNISSQFFEKAKRQGLSQRETWILYHIAKFAELKDVDSIFTLAKAFEIGSAAMFEQASSGLMADNEAEQLKSEISILREKLAFKKTGGIAAVANGKTITTKDIEVGQKLYLTRREGKESHNIEGEIIENNSSQLKLKLSMPISNHQGHQWRVRNYNGKYVLEFDVKSIDGQGDIIILAHTNEVRAINRRRYHRVPVQLQAYMAAFPFEKQIIPDSDDESVSSFENHPVLPEFSPVVVTELAGPGLKIETSIELKTNQRVALVFYLPSENNQPGRKKVIRVVEDIGEVRHSQEIEKGYAAAIELTGLNEKDVNELVRATNVAAVQSNGRQNDNPEDEAELSEMTAVSALEVSEQ